MQNVQMKSDLKWLVYMNFLTFLFSSLSLRSTDGFDRDFGRQQTLYVGV